MIPARREGAHKKSFIQYRKSTVPSFPTPQKTYADSRLVNIVEFVVLDFETMFVSHSWLWLEALVYIKEALGAAWLVGRGCSSGSSTPNFQCIQSWKETPSTPLTTLRSP